LRAREWIVVAVAVAFAGSLKAEASGDLVVYHSWDDQVARVLLDAFAAREGVSVSGMRRSSRHLVKIIEAEADAPVASVIMAGSIPSYEMLKQAGLLQIYRPAGAEAIPGEFRDPDETWTGIYLGVIGFGTDPRQTQEVPRSLDDLKGIRFPRGLVYSNPATSGTAYTFFLGLIAVYGEEGAFAYLDGIHPEVVEIPSGGAMTVRLVELQEATVAVAFAHDILRAESRGCDLTLSFPEEGSGWEVGGAALLRGAPNPGLGKKFLDFLVRPQTQEMIWRKGGMPVYPTHPEAHPPPEAPPLSSIRRVKIDFVEAGRHWDRRAERWNRRFPRSR
jgi:iron(III) transport system substrate-binding protein